LGIKKGHSQWLRKVVMRIDLNAFFPYCEKLRDPSLIGKTHAVIMTDQDTAEDLIVINTKNSNRLIKEIIIMYQ
jgi:hypothetical protein